MWRWPERERYLSQIDSAAQPLIETEPALIHIIARGYGSSATWGLGGHSVIIVEYQQFPIRPESRVNTSV